jgi:hypothetical protein
VLKKLVVKTPVDIEDGENVGVPLMVTVEVPMPDTETPGGNPPVPAIQVPPETFKLMVEME